MKDRKGPIRTLTCKNCTRTRVSETPARRRKLTRINGTAMDRYGP